MATFAKTTFSASRYASFRPNYPPSLFQTILSYHHQHPRPPSSTATTLALDLGCGHGLISRALSPSFTKIIALDPSPPMVSQAISSSPSPQYANIHFQQGSAEDLSSIAPASVDMAVAGQAAHWFGFPRAWDELARTVRRGGTVAFWGYKDNYFVDYPTATAVLDDYCYGKGEDRMGMYWEQPGRDILRGLYRDIVPPEGEWEMVVRREYEPKCEGKGTGEGEVLMCGRMKLGEMEGYLRTFSAYHSWMAGHEGFKAIKDGGEGDIVDEMLRKMLKIEPDWKAQGEAWRDFEVENEWGSVILLARRK